MHEKSDFAKISKILLNSDLKIIILLDQNQNKIILETQKL